MGWALWSWIITSGKVFPLRVLGCVVYIKTGGLFCSGIFGAVRVLYIWVFTIYDMEEKNATDVSEGGRVCAGGVFSEGRFCVESFNLSEMGYKWTNGA